MKEVYIYIITSKRNGTLYTGVTSNLQRRMYEHKNGIFQGFTKIHNIKLLVYYEQGNSISEAISREKYIKGKTRQYKLNLIEALNPEWNDLSKEWFI